MVKIADVTHWLKLRGDRGVHILASGAEGAWCHTLCGTMTPCGEVRTEGPERPQGFIHTWDSGWEP